MTTIRAAVKSLKEGQGSLAFGVPVDLDADGLRIVLDVPPLLELERAELRLQAPEDSAEIALQPAATTSAGPLVAGQAVEWISVDWGSRRPLTYLEIVIDPGQPAARGRLKVSEGGPWFPPLPFEFIPFNQGVRLSGVTATRVLVESVNERSEKLKLSVKGITLKVAARPPDLMAAIAGEVPFFKHTLLLGAGEVLVLADELTSALSRAWPADLRGGTLNLDLRCSAAAKLQSMRLTLAACTLTRVWEGGAGSLPLQLGPGELGQAMIHVPDREPLRSLAFTVSAAPRTETVPLLPKPRIDPLVCHLLGSGFRAAQAFSTPDSDALLVGIDLYLQPLTPAIGGTVTVYPDTYGRPADAPFDKAQAALVTTEKGDAPWTARWVSLDLPEPVPVKDQVFWLALDLPQGEALWVLGDTPQVDPNKEVALRGSRFQARGDRAWREREPVSALAGWPLPSAYARPRFRAQVPPPAPLVRVRWGADGPELAAPVGEGGRVTLDERALATLSAPSKGDQRLQVLVRSTVGAVVTLSALELRTRWSRTFP